MQTAELNFSGFEHLLDPRHERDPDAVTQFHAIEAEILDLAQHVVAVGMPPGVPAGGEGDHAVDEDSVSAFTRSSRVAQTARDLTIAVRITLRPTLSQPKTACPLR